MAEEAKKEKPAAEEKPAAPEGSGGGASKIVPIIVILNLILTLGIGSVVFIQFQKDKHHEAVSDIKPDAEKPAGEHGGGDER